MPASASYRFHERCTVALLFWGWASSYFTRNHLPTTMGELQRQLPLSNAAMRSTVSLGLTTFLLGKIFLGRYIDVYGGKRALLFTLYGSALASLAVALLASSATFPLLWGLARITHATGWGGCLLVMRLWVPQERRGAALAVLSLSFLSGDFLTRFVLSGVLAHTNLRWQGLWCLASLAQILLAIPVHLYLRDSPQRLGFAPLKEDGDEGSSTSSTSTSNSNNHNNNTKTGSALQTALQTVLRLVRTTPVLPVAVIAMALTATREFFNAYGAELLLEHGASEAEAAFRSAVFALAGVPSSLLAGVLIDRAPPRRKGLVAFTFLVGLPVPLLWLRQPQLSLDKVTFLLGLAGFLCIAAYSCMYVYITSLGPPATVGTVSSVIDAIGLVGAAGIMKVDAEHLYGLLAGSVLAAAVCAVLYDLCFGPARDKAPRSRSKRPQPSPP